MDEAEEQLEVLKRKIAQLKSRRTELERRMEAVYEPAKRINQDLTEIFVFSYVLERNKKRVAKDLVHLGDEWEEVRREIKDVFASATLGLNLYFSLL